MAGGGHIEGDIEFLGDAVATAEGDDAEGDIGIDEAGGDGRDGAIAASGDDMGSTSIDFIANKLGQIDLFREMIHLTAVTKQFIECVL